MKNSEFEKLAHERFDSQCTAKIYFSSLRGLIESSEENGVVDEVAQYIMDNPGASISDALKFLHFLTTDGQPLEIVDDDELDEED